MKIKSVQIKIISLIILILFTTISATIVLTVNNQKNDLLEAAKNTLSVNTDILHNMIKGIMLSGEAPIAVRTLANIKSIPELKEVEIYRIDGEVAFNDYDTINFVNEYQDIITFEKTIRAESKMSDNEAFSRAVETGRPYDNELTDTLEMEYFFPIRNERDCWVCHGTSEETHPIRGVAHFKISIAGVYQKINQARLYMIILFSSTFVLLAFILIFFMRRVIVRPLLVIGQSVREFAEGDLDIRVDLNTGDEFDVLGNTLNDMFVSIRERFELSKFVSRSTDERIKSGLGLAGEGQKKEISILFSDIRGFTSYADKNEPDTVVENLNGILQVQAETVEDFGGDVDKFVGDEIMAVFEDPLTAIKAAYEMIVKVKLLNQDRGTDLFVGIGINTGEVIAGNIGSTSRMEYAIIGDPVNLASRLCDLAKPNMILISETTYQQVKDYVTVKPVSNQQIKGKSGAVQFYVIQSIKKQY